VIQDGRIVATGPRTKVAIPSNACRALSTPMFTPPIACRD
jgi:hypothetical protein